VSEPGFDPGTCGLWAHKLTETNFVLIDCPIGGGGAGSGDVVVDGSLLMMYIAANMHYPKEKLESKNLMGNKDTCNNVFDLKGNNLDEELDHTFAACKFCLLAADSLLINYWIFDTRAPNHMTPFLKNLINAAKLLFQPKINLPNGFTSFITHTGTDWTTKRVLALAKQRLGLYFLLNIPFKSIDARLQSLILSTCATTSFFLILLGHISDSKLQHVTCVPNSTLKSNTISCFSRPMAKFTKLPYELSDSYASEIFDLIHIDIWGPYKVVTNGKYKYFLTIVDDCSRVTWTYLLVQKSDSFSFLKYFISFVSNQFNETIKTVRSDNALEFVKGPCHLFLAEQGIVHQTSCVDRPQQNARVERKHRHILEIARALRFHSHLTLHHWGDCVITATYLINRMPSSVLKNKTPYEILLKKVPNYDHLRVFGYFAMAFNPSRVSDKFAPKEVTRADQGIFISHKKYTLEFLKEYGVQNAKPYKLLKDHNLKLQADIGSPLADPETYRKLIGKLIYLTITRLDICYTVQLLSQFMQNPTSIHMQAAKHLLRYLIPAAYLTAYCDSDWASCPMSRRSTTGYCILLGESPISWKSKKQVVVSLLKDIGLTDLGPADLHCDNQVALHIEVALA
ncbi:retrovirus-related pol polyprotein from transposon TNT 1-94, partial [Tanacetum coccineum]